VIGDLRSVYIPYQRITTKRRKKSGRKTKYFDGYLLSRCVRFVKQRSGTEKSIALEIYTHFKALVILIEVPHHQEMLKDKISRKTLQSQTFGSSSED